MDRSSKTVMTLDAGGTNFVFSALQDGREIVEAISKPSNANELDLCIETLLTGFSEVQSKLGKAADAISFAFPGPADYPRGIIGDLANFKAFRGGVPLKSILEKHFKVPVFINNDGNLFAYGEAIGGALPSINAELEKKGIHRRYKHLIGLTLGTGFGCGITIDGRLLLGDTSNSAEVFITRSRTNPEYFAEEGVSIRAIQRVYARESGVEIVDLEPKEIFLIAEGKMAGNVDAAEAAFAEYGRNLGDAMAHLVSLIDGVVVLGGGIAQARKYIIPALLAELRAPYGSASGEPLSRPIQNVLNLDDPTERKKFFDDDVVCLQYPGLNETIFYNPNPKLCLTFSEDASRSIALGAYHFAVNELG